MARKSKSSRKAGEHFDAESGQVLSADRSSTGISIKAKIECVREVVPNLSKNDVALILQSCDYNVENTISCFTSGDADAILAEWNIQGRKNGSAGKRKKKKKPMVSENDCGTPEENRHSKEARKFEPAPTVAVVSMVPDLKLEAKPDIPPLLLEHPTTNIDNANQTLLFPPSPSDSAVSTPKSISSNESNGEKPSSSEHASHRSKIDRLPSFSGPEALKKTVKDLQRSSVTLPRLQLLLEEECEKSTTAIRTTFEKLRQCLNGRETVLAEQMAKLKCDAVDLLQQRQENAAALKLKADRVGGMDEAHISELRNEIRNFVSERKFDEELAKTSRFVCDEAKLNKEIELFGEVVPIKNLYKPVVLNPTPPSEPAEKKSDPPAQPAGIFVPSPPVLDAGSSLGPREVSELHQTAEIHARLQASLKLQGISLDVPRLKNRRGKTKQQVAKDQSPDSNSQQQEPAAEKKVQSTSSNETKEPQRTGANVKNVRPKKEEKQKDGGEGPQSFAAKRGARAPREEKRKERAPSAGGRGSEPRSPRTRSAQPKKEEAHKENGPGAGVGDQGGVAQLEQEPRSKVGAKREEERGTPHSPRRRNAQSEKEEAHKETGPGAGAENQGGVQLQQEPQSKDDKQNGEEKPTRARAPRFPRKRNARAKKEDGPASQSSDGQGRREGAEDSHAQNQEAMGGEQASLHSPDKSEEQTGVKEEQPRKKRRGGRKKRGDGNGVDKSEESSEGAGKAQEGGDVGDKEEAGQQVSGATKKKRPKKRPRSSGRKNKNGPEVTASGGEGSDAKAEQDEEEKGEAAAEEAAVQGADRTNEGAQAEAAHVEDVVGDEAKGSEAQQEGTGRAEVVEATKDEGVKLGSEAEQETSPPAEDEDEMNEKKDEAREVTGPSDGVEGESSVVEEKAKTTSAANAESAEHSDGVKVRDEETNSSLKEKASEKAVASHANKNSAATTNGAAEHATDQQESSAPTEALPQRKPRSPRRRNPSARGQGVSPNNEHSMIDAAVDNGIASHGTKAPQTEGVSEGATMASTSPAPAQEAPEGEKAVGDDAKAGSVNPTPHMNGLVQVNGTIEECLVER